MKKVAEHLPLDRRQVADAGDLALVVLDRFLDLIAERRLALFAEKEGPETAPETSPILLGVATAVVGHFRSEEHTSELQSLMRISYAVFCLKKKKKTTDRLKQATSR